MLALAIVANLSLSVGFKMYFFEAPLINNPVAPPIPVADIQPVAPENPVEEMAPIVDDAPAPENPVAPEGKIDIFVNNFNPSELPSLFDAVDRFLASYFKIGNLISEI